MRKGLKEQTKKHPHFIEQLKRKLAIPFKKTHAFLYPLYSCKGIFVGGGAVGKTAKGRTTQNKGVAGKGWKERGGRKEGVHHHQTDRETDKPSNKQASHRLFSSLFFGVFLSFLFLFLSCSPCHHPPPLTSHSSFSLQYSRTPSSLPPRNTRPTLPTRQHSRNIVLTTNTSC